MKIKNRKNRLINSTKDSIYHLYPKVVSIDIKVRRLRSRGFASRITLKTKTESFLAEKEDLFYGKSLEKSYHAITKQLERVKINKIHGPYIEMVFEGEFEDKNVA